ncbi:MAG TPA: hypothetical protein ENN38_04350 [Actinobacteria bacterium]|nr:hypothetical protein [Actinomycetota bacterium]
MKNPPPTPNEVTQKIILNCVRWGLPNFNASILEDVPKDEINWNGIIPLAREHGLLPLLCKATQSEKIPEDIRDMFKKEYLNFQISTLIGNNVLLEILKALNEKKNPTIPLKGPFLAENIYSLKEIRGYTDLDLLVKENDLPTIENLLAKLNYKPLAETPKFKWEEPYPEKVFEKKAGGPPVELQWNIIGKTSYLKSSNFDVSEIWNESSGGKLLGQEILQMKPEHLLIYLSLHFAITHRFERLIWLRDIAEVINFYEKSLDWDYLSKCIIKWQAKSFVYFPLLLAKNLLKANIPDEALKKIRPNYFLARIFEKKLLTMKTWPKKYSLTTLFFLVSRDKLAYRLKTILALPWQAIRWRIFGKTR